MKLRHLLFTLLGIAVLALCAWIGWMRSDKRQVQKVFERASHLMEKKEGGAGLVAEALRTREIMALFTDEVRVTLPELRRSNQIGSRELARQAILLRTHFSEMTLDFANLSIEVPSKGEADATCQARLSGAAGGEWIEEERTVSAHLRKDPSAKRWQFSRIVASEGL